MIASPILLTICELCFSESIQAYAVEKSVYYNSKTKQSKDLFNYHAVRNQTKQQMALM